MENFPYIVYGKLYGCHNSCSKSSNEEMTLAEFKFIWTMEYIHRMWGRAVGIVFLVPCAFFWVKGHFSSAMKKRMFIVGTLICFQVSY